MAELAQKTKEALALLYERSEFKALEKWSEIKRLEAAEMILNTDMSNNGADKKVALLQGQAYAHKVMLLELRKIHKDVTKNEN